MSEPIRDVTLIHAKDHPVLADAPEWRLEGLRMEFSGDPAVGARIEMIVRRDGDALCLRCDGATDLAMRTETSGVALRILDVTHLQWDGITVRVESECGALRFWARSALVLWSDRGIAEKVCGSQRGETAARGNPRERLSKPPPGAASRRRRMP